VKENYAPKRFIRSEYYKMGGYMSEEERLRKMKRLKEELMMAYIIDGLLIGLKREEAEALIEERVKVIMERIESIRKAIEEYEKRNDASQVITIVNGANGKTLFITSEGKAGIEYGSKEYYESLEIKTHEFVERLFRDQNAWS
jgi:hypothetical protein